MKILVINCGSSSLKYQLIDMTDESVLAKGLCERIGIDGSKLTHQVPGKDKYIVEKAMPDHKVAIGLVLELSLIHISEPTRLRCISYAVFCLKKKQLYRLPK